MRYKLRSSTVAASSDNVPEPPVKRARQSDDGAKAAKGCRRKPLNALQKSVGSQTSEVGDHFWPANSGGDEVVPIVMNLPIEIIHHIFKYCDSKTMLNFYSSCKWFYHMLRESDTFWRLVCNREELSHYQCINGRLGNQTTNESEVINESNNKQWKFHFIQLNSMECQLL